MSTALAEENNNSSLRHVGLVCVQDVRNVWHGYAIQQQLPSSECIEALMGHTEEHFARYKRSQLGDCLQYWAQLRIVPNPVLMSRLKVVSSAGPSN